MLHGASSCPIRAPGQVHLKGRGVLEDYGVLQRLLPFRGAGRPKERALWLCCSSVTQAGRPWLCASGVLLAARKQGALAVRKWGALGCAVAQS